MGAGASGEPKSIRQERCCHDAVDHTCPSPPRFQQALPASSPSRPEAPLSQRGFLDKSIRGKWEYEHFPGQWRQFEAEISERLECSYQEGKLETAVVIGGRLVSISFEHMTQKAPHASSKNIQRTRHESGNDAPLPSGEHSDGVPKKSVTDPFSADADLTAVESLTRSIELSNEKLQPELQSTILAHESPVYGITFSIGGDKIVTGAKDGSCRFWELQTSFVITDFEEHPGAVLACALSKTNERIVATGSDDCNARIFDVTQKEPKFVLEGHQHKVYAISFTSDGKSLATISMDCDMRVWDVNTAQCLRCIQAHSSSIFNLQTSPLSPWLAITAGDDAVLAAHDLRLQHTVTQRFIGHEKTLWGCDIRYDEGQYISCGMDSKVLIWDPRNNSSPFNTITSHKNPVHCVEYMPDGLTFLSSARDRSFKLTIADTGKQVFSCNAHDGNVYKVTYNAAKGLAMTCGSDAVVKLWKLPPLFS